MCVCVCARARACLRARDPDKGPVSERCRLKKKKKTPEILILQLRFHSAGVKLVYFHPEVRIVLMAVSIA